MRIDSSRRCIDLCSDAVDDQLALIRIPRILLHRSLFCKHRQLRLHEIDPCLETQLFTVTQLSRRPSTRTAAPQLVPDIAQIPAQLVRHASGVSLFQHDDNDGDTGDFKAWGFEML